MNVGPMREGELVNSKIDPNRIVREPEPQPPSSMLSSHLCSLVGFFQP
jgi:hypothetical protein